MNIGRLRDRVTIQTLKQTRAMTVKYSKRGWTVTHSGQA